MEREGRVFVTPLCVPWSLCTFGERLAGAAGCPLQGESGGGVGCPIP